MSAHTITSGPPIQRLLPQSADAERGLLCSFMLGPMDTGSLCAEKGIRAEHFHLPAHAILFQRLYEMWMANDPIDLLTITQQLRDYNELEAAGGAALVTEIFTYLPTAALAENYAEILHEKATLRAIIKVGTEFAGRAYAEQDDPMGLLGEVTTQICGIANVTTLTKPKTPREIVLEATDRAEERMAKRGMPDYIMRTGISKIDESMGGIRPADYVLVSGKEKSGKTSLAFNIFEHVVFTQQKKAFVASMEMKIPEITDRLIASMGRINLTRACHAL
jgi:replicative DNA helicase